MCDVSESNNIFLYVVLMSAGASVHSTSSSLVNAPTSITQPTSTQTTAFVQPTQQQAPNQDAGPSMEAERPSTSSSVIGTGEQNHVPNPPVLYPLYHKLAGLQINWPMVSHTLNNAAS